MSNLMIRGLKFTTKGGEGSGWYGPPKGDHVSRGNLVPSSHAHQRKVDVMSVKQHVREYFQARNMARGRGGKRVAVKRQLLGYTEDHSPVYQHVYSKEFVYEVKGNVDSILYYPTAP